MTEENKPKSILITIRQAAGEYKITQKRIRGALDKKELICYKAESGNKASLLYRTDIEKWLNKIP